MMNKKGDEGYGLGTFLALLAGLIGVVIVVVWFMGGFGKIGELFSTSTSGTAVEAAIQACDKIAVGAESTYLFCEDFKKVSFPGGTEYVNCADTRIASKLSQQLNCKGNEVQVFCDATAKAEALKAGILDSDKYKSQLTKSCNNLKVNGLTCSQQRSPLCTTVPVTA